MNIPYSLVSLKGNESKYIQEVLDSGWLTTASKALSFEKKFAEFVGAKHACAVNSCTAALHLAVESIGISMGDKVLVPSLTFTASAEVVRYMGADPILLDVEYNTGLLTPEIIEEALQKYKDIKALILVHYAGQSANMETLENSGIIDICHKKNIKVIQDAAHAFPTKFNGKYIGSFGDITCFSFYANKTITTGEGGMLTTNDDEIYERVKIMRLHGINRDIWNRFTSIKSTWEYDVIAPGFKYNMPDINAAIGLAQLERAEFLRYERQRCAEYYFLNLDSIEELDLPFCSEPYENHSWHLFPIIIKPESVVSRNEFINKISEKGIGVSVHYKPIHQLSYYKKKYNLNPNDFPNTEKIWKGTVSLPIYPELNELELQYICTAVKSIVC